jgi:hypothetical protein
VITLAAYAIVVFLDEHLTWPRARLALLIAAIGITALVTR